jgi:ABC-2 type transport system ATP-binding protein
MVADARDVVRVRAISAVFGISAALLSGYGIASADSAPTDTGPSVSDRADSRPADRPTVNSRVSQQHPEHTAAPRTARSSREARPAPARQPGAALSSGAATRATQDEPPMPAPAPTSAPEAQAQALSLSVDPQLRWTDGILRGTVGAISAEDLTFTLVSPPSLGGKLGADVNTNRVLFGPQGQFSYLPAAEALTEPGRLESFAILVAENTPFDKALTSIPLLGLLAGQVLQLLHRTPVLGELLSPIIGASQTVTFTVEPHAQAAGRPTAFTYLMPSFDSTPISVNYFPALDVARGEVDSAPTVLMSPGLPGPGDTDPDNPFGQLLSAANQFGSLTPGLPILRSGTWASPDGRPSYDSGGGYNVITWDPRGEYASGGVLQLDNPFYEGRDVSSIVTWATGTANTARQQVAVDATGDPLIGMVGGSYGGGIQLTAASVDPRIDAIVPQLAWNSLLSSLYPNGNQFKTAMGSGLLIALAVTGARINPQIYQGVLTGLTLGILTQTAQAALASSGPTVLVAQLQAPTLLFQGMEDVLFGLTEAVTNAQAILANPYGTPVKMVWFCGGHGTCLDPLNPHQDDAAFVDNLKWLDQYVTGDPDNPADTIPAFQWYDQRGVYRSADLLPFQPGFNVADPYRVTGSGGLLGIVSTLGGSGPSPLDQMPYSIGNGGRGWNALNLSASPDPGSQIVGAPQLSFSYAGLGTSRTVYTQLVDNGTGRVLGNMVTPIPVILDGRNRTVSIPMEQIAYTAGDGDSLTLQITSSASSFANVTAFGVIDISEVVLELPIRAGGRAAVTH